MVNTEKLRSAINLFENHSQLHSYDSTEPATVEDLQRLRKSIVEVLTKFVDELE